MGVCFIVGAAKGAMGPPSPVPISVLDEKEYLSLYTLIEKVWRKAEMARSRYAD